MSLTPRQVHEINTAIRHLGRAMKALERANIPLPRDYATSTYRLNLGVDLVGKASDALIAGVSSTPSPTTDEQDSGA